MSHYKLRKRNVEKVSTYKRNEFKDVKSIVDLIELSNLTNPPKKYSYRTITILKRIQPHLELLENMVGMKSLKQTIFSQILYYLQNLHLGGEGDYLHTVIYGEPGCGKTEVARIIGNIYTELGILKNRTFNIAYRQDMVGEYLGQTALKTHNLLQRCQGGVLFIDEVYALGTSASNDKDTFGKEAIDTLNVFLSEHKSDFCCIIAGYKEEVEKLFFGSNKGLSRRFPWVHIIDKYTEGELCEILSRKITKIGWSISYKQEEMIELIKKYKECFKNFGGDIETLLTKAKIEHSLRIFNEQSKKTRFVLNIQDFEKALIQISNNRKPKENTKTYENMFL